MAIQSKTAFLEHFPLFETLNPDEKLRLIQMVEVKVKPRFSYIYLPGEASDKIFFLSKGTVKIGTHSKDGKEIIKSILHPTAMFGEMGIVGEEERQDFARAMGQEVHYCILKVEDFKRLMRSNHQLSIKILMLIGDRLRRAENRLESLIFKDARTRIIDFLKDAADQRGRRVGFEMLVKHSLTQQDIANLTGTSRQTVTSVLNELRKSNLIYFNRKSILIRDMESLV
ncbi:MAG: Crp/Fnr family transcriptional regulator [Saprospiraceae bacterium]|nr:Crp/Fnr family transcriptional regulator [Saprospiraceae bacterium]MDG2420025.1 Crp/Fnr family transcriptional regulator [Saprospiraceae bacterium]